MHPKGANSMTMSGLGCRKALDFNKLSHLVGPPFLVFKVFSYARVDGALTKSLLIDGCG